MCDGINNDQVNLSSRTNLRLVLIQVSICIHAHTCIQHMEDEVCLIGLYVHKQVSLGCPCLPVLRLGVK